jgi:hypothetical protein
MTHNMSSSVAFTKTADGMCRSVRIELTSTGVKLVWKHSCESSSLDESLSSAGLSRGKTHTVLGIDPAGVGFYNIEIPQVPEAQLDSIVRMQAETILPLPLEQMEIAYHCGRVIADKCRVTIAAGRSTQLKSELAFAKECKAASIVLSSEAIAKAFDTLFNITQKKYIVLNMRGSDTQVLLCEDGKLVHAVKLDIGIDDINDAERKCGEMFVYELRNTLEMLDVDSSDKTMIYVFSGSRELTEDVVAGLNDVGILSETAELKLDAIKAKTDLSDDEVFEYIEPIGCALLAVDGEKRPLNLFSNLHNLTKKKKKKKSSGFAVLLRAAAVFVVMLLATFFTFNYLNKLELVKYANPELDKLVAEQKTRKLIAQQRPDIIDLFTQLNEDAPGGMKLNVISFKKGEKVTVASQASSHEKIVEIEKFLSNKKDFSGVTRQNPTYDAKTKKYKFKLNFHYKHWTRKSIR